MRRLTICYALLLVLPAALAAQDLVHRVAGLNQANLRVSFAARPGVWLGHADGAAATRGLDSLARDTTGDLEVRKHAIFALSHRPADEGVPATRSTARPDPDAELRKTALFWLGQSEDPRAIALFE